MVNYGNTPHQEQTTTGITQVVTPRPFTLTSPPTHSLPNVSSIEWQQAWDGKQSTKRHVQRNKTQSLPYSIMAGTNG